MLYSSGRFGYILKVLTLSLYTQDYVDGIAPPPPPSDVYLVDELDNFIVDELNNFIIGVL